MRKLILFAAALFCLVSCNQPKAEPADELVTDQYGVVTRVNPGKKTVYLVFTGHFSLNDNGAFENFDGIDPVLDTLADRGVKGSFFPTGVCFDQPKYEESIKRIIADGHYLSAHSYAHLLLCDESTKETSVTKDSLIADIAKMEAVLQRFGLEKKDYDYMIPPYENYNQETADWLKELGFSLCNHTAGIHSSSDWLPEGAKGFVSGLQNVQSIYDYEEKNGLDGCVVLIHAMVYPGRQETDRTFTHLGEVIDTLRERGYDFDTFKNVSRQQ